MWDTWIIYTATRHTADTRTDLNERSIVFSFDYFENLLFFKLLSDFMMTVQKHEEKKNLADVSNENLSQ